MNLTPREKDKLLVAMAALIARRRLERGVKLNYPEAVALITDFVVEGARDGRSVALTQHGEALYSRARKMLKMNAEIMDQFSDEDLSGAIRFGLPDDYAVRLLPVILFAVAFTRRTDQAAGGPRPPLLPWFAVGFAVLVAINSTGWLPRPLARTGSELSGWFLVAAMAGIGMKTQLRELVTVGLRPVVLMVGETVFLAVLAIALLRWMP